MRRSKTKLAEMDRLRGICNFEGSGTGEAFRNYADFIATPSRVGSEFNYLDFDNSGTVDVQSGYLLLLGGGTSSGHFTGQVDTNLYFGGNLVLTPTATVEAYGLLVEGTLNLQLDSGPNGARFADIKAQSVRLFSPVLTLSPSNSFVSHLGDRLTILKNTGGNAITGKFAGLNEGSPITLVDGTQFRISYQGIGGPDDTGNDVILTVTFTPIQQVQIDIKPDSASNPINLVNQGVIPVAILGSASFSVSQVDVNSVLFAGAHAIHSAFQDVNGDGIPDLVLQFRTQDTNLLTAYQNLLAAADAIGGNSVVGALDTGVSTHQSTSVLLTGNTLLGGLFDGGDMADLFLAGDPLRQLLNQLAAQGLI